MRINIDKETGLAETPEGLFWEVRDYGQPTICLSHLWDGDTRVAEGPWYLDDWSRMTDRHLTRATVRVMKERARDQRKAERRWARVQRENDRLDAKEAKRAAKYGEVREILDRYVGTYPPKRVS